MPCLLAADVGGTKTLLSLYRVAPPDQGPAAEAAPPEPLAVERFVSSEWDDPAAMVRTFLQRADPDGRHRPVAACFAVAGPVQAGRARLTNLSWCLEEVELARRCGIGRLELVNDFAVLVYGLPHLRAEQQASIRPGRPEPGEPLLILGAGTGLGVAIGVPTVPGLRAVASEASHAAFAPADGRQWELREWLRRDLRLERVSIERVVSGTGLGHLARWLLAGRHPDGDHPLSAVAGRWADQAGETGEDTAATSAGRADLPAEVAAAAAAGDPLALEALGLWLEIYGAVTGDLALGCLSRGGIWLAGGTAAKLLEPLRSPRFAAAFLAKGRLSPVLEPMPIQALIDPEMGSFSAACRARMLLG
jgi:glucokinase